MLKTAPIFIAKETVSVRLIDLAAKGTQLENGRASIQTLVSRFQIQDIKNHQHHHHHSKPPKSVHDSLFFSEGDLPITVLMGVEGSFHVMLVWSSLSHHTGSHLFLQCLKHVANDWAQMLTHSKADDVTASSMGIFLPSCHCLAYGQQEWKWIWIRAAVNIISDSIHGSYTWDKILFCLWILWSAESFWI